jgi:hypothetical protein
MPNKSFSIYSADDFTVDEGDQLVIEIAKTHIACLARKGNKKLITGCELFDFSEEEGQDLETLLGKVTQQSKIINTNFASINVFINNQFCIPVPIFKFNREIALEYLNLAFGTDFYAAIQFEHLPVEPGIMNVYRVDRGWYDVLRRQFRKSNIRHTYSTIIRTHLNKKETLSEEFLTVHFYNAFIIVVVLKYGVLHLIQTFAYETPEDVLYHLLNVSTQFGLYKETVTVQISGMIDKHFVLYRELITYFKKVKVEYVDEGHLLLNTGDYPLHYFTPYLNLAL